MASAKRDVAARKRAREAKAGLDAQRAKRDELILGQTTAFYLAVDEAQDAREALEAAEVAKGTAVLALAELGQTLDEIAALCDLTVADVRGFKKARQVDAAASTGGSVTSFSEPEQTELAS